LSKQGTGTVILSGTNSYTGATYISDGVLQFNTIPATSMISLTNGSSVVFDLSSTGTFANEINDQGYVQTLCTGQKIIS